jgi:hypothetical protein
MNWSTNNDIDLWLKLPNNSKVGYSCRDVPPAHLDVDVVAWRRYEREGYTPTYDEMAGDNYNEFGEYQEEHVQAYEEFIIKDNEEIITIRNILEGEYVVNAHYYADRGYGTEPIKVQILVQDIQNKRVLYSGHKIISNPREETHFVKFTVTDEGGGKYSVDRVFTDRPTYFLGSSK